MIGSEARIPEVENIVVGESVQQDSALMDVYGPADPRQLLRAHFLVVGSGFASIDGRHDGPMARRGSGGLRRRAPAVVVGAPTGRFGV